MTENFHRVVEFTLKWEGGYSNDPDDPGGETNYGISKRAYPRLDIKNLSKEAAIAIYRRDYWDKAGCNDMPYPMDMVVFDTAVNCGVVRAIQWAEYRTHEGVLLERIDHYRQLANKKDGYRKYLQGWLNRTMDLWGLVCGK